MSFGPPRRNPSRAHKSSSKAAAEEAEKKEKLRQLASDRHNAWMTKKQPDAGHGRLQAWTVGSQQDSSSSSRRHLSSAVQKESIPVKSSLLPPPSSASLHLFSNNNGRVAHVTETTGLAHGHRTFWSSMERLQEWDASQSNCEGANAPERPPNRQELTQLADSAVRNAKGEAYHYGRVDRPDSHFCQQCKKLMSLTGHNAMCLIPCAHTFCEACVSKSLQRCPSCALPVKTATFNVLLQKIIDRFSDEHGLWKQDPQDEEASGPAQMALEDVAGAPDYVPNPQTLNRWADQLASVEMRVSVIDVEARQLSKQLISNKTRYQGALTDMKKLEAEEEKLSRQLQTISEELEVVRRQKEAVMDDVRMERASEEKVREQLNLTNYTKAGLEAELEKLRLLCNRKY